MKRPHSGLSSVITFLSMALKEKEVDERSEDTIPTLLSSLRSSLRVLIIFILLPRPAFLLCYSFYFLTHISFSSFYSLFFLFLLLNTDEREGKGRPPERKEGKGSVSLDYFYFITITALLFVVLLFEMFFAVQLQELAVEKKWKGK